jgi:hypothetical protein
MGVVWCAKASPATPKGKCFWVHGTLPGAGALLDVHDPPFPPFPSFPCILLS